MWTGEWWRRGICTDAAQVREDRSIVEGKGIAVCINDIDPVMIKKVVLRNFKRFKEETFEFNSFDLIVGANNSGKSTILQALAIWQYCVDQFSLEKRTGKTGIQIVLPNFTALPVPEFNLLWKDRTDRSYPKNDQGVAQRSTFYILIEIDVYWKGQDQFDKHFCVQLRYQTPQSVYAIPKSGWADFKDLSLASDFPRIVYVPPFSGIEPHEQWMDDGNVKQHVGKSQPGSVLRNLLLRVIDNNNDRGDKDWEEISSVVKTWFNVDLQRPQYTRGISTEIKVEYKVDGKLYDVISGGSGFHQILTLLAFLYGYKGVNTILLDEPDAHLHNNLQRTVINFFLSHGVQFLIATHSEEFIRDIDIHSILSIMSGTPKRVLSNVEIIHALSDVDNNDIIRTQESPFILYLEGEDDDRILAEWARILGKEDIYQRFYPYILGGANKKIMQERSDSHFRALKQIVPNLKRVLLLDYDGDDAYHPDNSNPVYHEWKRKNIDNYLLVPSAWEKAVAIVSGESVDSLFLEPYSKIIEEFFAGQNLLLPPNSSWRDVKADIFAVLDGKKILFEKEDALFRRISEYGDRHIKLNRQRIASVMSKEELHQDIWDFFDALEQVVTN